MKKISCNRFLYYLIPMIVTGIICIIGYIFINGIPLFNVPEIEEVSYVEISDSQLDIKSRKFTKVEDIEKAISLTNFLYYSFGKPEQKEPLIKFSFHLKDGKSYVISSNEKTVFVNGKAYKLKGDNGKTFTNLTEGIFFFSEMVEKEKDK
ncbi:hypothetical protein SH2C18_35740 [Clostridium sediminicola]|uniref:hypothetical protein n=1 Tax=Clostridium sediminicola TaxID=3114879 RepID=UPI0031F2259B